VNRTGKAEQKTTVGSATINTRVFFLLSENPHNCSGEIFALKAQQKQFAIFCDSLHGPVFGGGYDISLRHIDASFTSFSSTYLNDTGLTGERFFTDSKKFRVKEIEVFNAQSNCFSKSIQMVCIPEMLTSRPSRESKTAFPQSPMTESLDSRTAEGMPPHIFLNVMYYDEWSSHFLIQ
jgi:hypothetical protein